MLTIYKQWSSDLSCYFIRPYVKCPCADGVGFLFRPTLDLPVQMAWTFSSDLLHILYALVQMACMFNAPVQMAWTFSSDLSQMHLL